MLYNLVMQFGDWLRVQFDAWNRIQGGDKNLAQFAKYLGVPPTSLSNWVNSGYKPRGDNLVTLAEKLGPEIYTVLGMPEPPDLRDQLIEAGFPAAFVEALLETRETYTRELESKGISTDTPEARRIVNEALARLAAQFTKVVKPIEDKSS